MLSYEAKKQSLSEQLRAGANHPIGLNKEKSNLFRDRKAVSRQKLDVSRLDQVLQVDTTQGWVEVEGMTPYDKLVAATLAHGVMPTVVPELKSITIGGAVSGIGIESSSFKYGLVHETVLAMDILLSDGSVVTCTPDNAYRDLFFGIPNSYGTLGYILKLKVRTVTVEPYVELRHIRYRDSTRYFQELAEHCQRKEIDFIDGTVFAPDELYLTLGKFVAAAPFTSDYTFENIYYRSIRNKETDYLTTADYIWRWDTDWFWCSKNLYVQNPLLRRLAGKSRLNSVSYTKVMRWNSRWQLTKRLNRLLGIHTESVIQDVDIPVAGAPEFLDFFQREIGITPIWVCPVQAYDPTVRFPLFALQPGKLYVNFGFWDVVKSRQPRPSGYFNRKIEHKVAELGGIKSLYSDAFYPPEEFWRQYDRTAYTDLKAQYDPQGRFKDLYQKTVLRE
ncbi:MAG: FAD-binding oxidoreductase [Candidatus Competibacteraceae bacterium]